ncbi:NPL4 family-domain-containing protein [Dunaliella salina]|uniref:NPL4 family-domain-containing protein n=1 Tax=Dunaliella salina TaxID=3046 RepID=A0ABQ7G6Z2_DUNSA|nr:NPL4 family-domain-containing protein [Dunaliella salina]|eukprot:KAF5830350.1 NPL4 family-domain-containing protein [Dunaliella salina]
MLLRLRSRDGLERVEIDDNATVAMLKQVINQKLNIPLHDMHLSKNPNLLASKAPQDIADLDNGSKCLKAVGVNHGDMLYMLYSGERQVQPAFKRSWLDVRPLGHATTAAEIAAKQPRISRQEEAMVASLSFDRDAANHFQSYVQSALAFSIKRGGFIYGTVDDSMNVKAEIVYEPPQDGTSMHLTLHRDTEEEKQVDFLAGLLGMKKVGWVYNQSTEERDFIMHADEVKQVAMMQDEIGDYCTTVIVSWEPASEEVPSGQVHFEAFQCSKQCVQLTKEGWLQSTPEGEKPGGVVQLRNPQDPGQEGPVMIASRDASEADVDYFLCAVKILDHSGPLSTQFPIENRLIPQTKSDLQDVLKEGGPSRPYVERLSDFHLLLWLSKQPNLDSNDMTLLCDAIRNRAPVLEGYRVIIDSIAGL